MLQVQGVDAHGNVAVGYLPIRRRGRRGTDMGGFDSSVFTGRGSTGRARGSATVWPALPSRPVNSEIPAAGIMERPSAMKKYFAASGSSVKAHTPSQNSVHRNRASAK